MATELTVQSERAFQKQPHIFLNHKSKAAKSKRVGKGGRRWYKDIGLGFKTPKEAINGSYIGMQVPRASSSTLFLSRLARKEKEPQALWRIYLPLELYGHIALLIVELIILASGHLQIRSVRSPAWSRSEAAS